MMDPLFLKEFKTSFRLAIPLITALVAEVGMQITNSIMMGYIGTAALAAGALAVSASIMILISMMGLTISAGIHIAQAQGASNSPQIIRYWQHGWYLVAIMSLPIMIILAHLHLFFQFFHQDPLVISLAQSYLWGELWSVPAILGYVFFKELCAVLEKTSLLILISACCLPLNALLNYCFIFGYVGFPKLGMLGIGLSTSIVSWLMFLTIIWYGYRHHLFISITRNRWQRLHLTTLWTICRTGIPIVLVIFFEAGLFVMSALMMGWLGVTTLAAHQIVIQYVDLIFMFSLGATQVATLRVAKFYGANDIAAIRRTVKANILISSLIAGTCSLILFTCATPLIMLFIRSHHETDLSLLSEAHTFFLIAAFFVYFDSLKLLGANALRGLQDTFVPMLLSVAAYWIIGLGSAYLLAFQFGWQGKGIWFGMILGVLTVTILLWLRWKRQLNKLQIALR